MLAPPVYIPGIQGPLQRKLGAGVPGTSIAPANGLLRSMNQVRTSAPALLPIPTSTKAATVQCKYDRPLKAGRLQLLWDKQKARLVDKDLWDACVEKATDIDTLTAAVDAALADRERGRSAEEARKKLASAERHAKHVEESQKAAKEARDRREAEEAAHEKKRKEEEAERIRLIEAAQEPKPRRRLESVARLLESPDNVCVAVTEVDGRYYAATNKGVLAPLRHDKGALMVSNLAGSTGRWDGREGERTRERDAAKVAASIADEDLSADLINNVTQVGTDLDDNLHAEMKLLDSLVKKRKTGNIEVYVSKLCCGNCRIAIDLWNESANQPKIRTNGTHGDYFPGWRFPQCIWDKNALREAIQERINGQEADNPEELGRGRSRVREGTKAQRERSISPPRKGVTVGQIATI